MLMRLAIAIATLYLVAGCAMIPEIAHQPTFRNPFPQITKVGVAPFFNHSTEPTLDQRQVALAYFNELQAIPGFDVTPIGVVENAARELGIGLTSYAEIRLVAQKLNLDAIVVGAVTDYSPYYPPRMALQVDWIAANECYHPIPVGYGLPWGTTDEEEIPQSLVDAAEFELAREQLKTQTPRSEPIQVVPVPVPLSRNSQPEAGVLGLVPRQRQRMTAKDSARLDRPNKNGERGTSHSASDDEPNSARQKRAERGTAAEEIQPPAGSTAAPDEFAQSAIPVVQAYDPGAELPPDWPDPRGFLSDPPAAVRPQCRPSNQPIMTHTRTYNGNDGQFTEALQNYVSFRDDARFGGWQSYLQRSDDFIRFCCHMHVTEMLSARGGAAETRVVWRWYERR